MVLRLLLLPVTGPVDGLVWLGGQILDRASAELDQKETLQKQLLALQLAYDLEEISEEEYDEREEALLLALQEIEDAEREAAAE